MQSASIALGASWSGGENVVVESRALQRATDAAPVDVAQPSGADRLGSDLDSPSSWGSNAITNLRMSAEREESFMSFRKATRIEVHGATAFVLATLLVAAVPVAAAPVEVELVYTYEGVQCLGDKAATDPLPVDIAQTDPEAIVARFVVDDSVFENGTGGFTDDFSDLLDFELVVSHLPLPTKVGDGVAKQTSTTTFTKNDLVGWVITVDNGEVLDINFFMWQDVIVGPAKSGESARYGVSLERRSVPAKDVNTDGFSIQGVGPFLLGVYFGDESPPTGKQQPPGATPVACFSGAYLGRQPVQVIPELSGPRIALLVLLMAGAGVVALHRRGLL
jgi:hypothetical protein